LGRIAGQGSAAVTAGVGWLSPVALRAVTVMSSCAPAANFPVPAVESAAGA